MQHKGKEITQILQSISLRVEQKQIKKQAQENIHNSIAKGHTMANEPHYF